MPTMNRSNDPSADAPFPEDAGPEWSWSFLGVLLAVVVVVVAVWSYRREVISQPNADMPAKVEPGVNAQSPAQGEINGLESQTPEGIGEAMRNLARDPNLRVNSGDPNFPQPNAGLSPFPSSSASRTEATAPFPDNANPPAPPNTKTPSADEKPKDSPGSPPKGG